jgi:hypothetical protein
MSDDEAARTTKASTRDVVTAERDGAPDPNRHDSMVGDGMDLSRYSAKEIASMLGETQDALKAVMSSTHLYQDVDIPIQRLIDRNRLSERECQLKRELETRERHRVEQERRPPPRAPAPRWPLRVVVLGVLLASISFFCTVVASGLDLTIHTTGASGGASYGACISNVVAAWTCGGRPTYRFWVGSQELHPEVDLFQTCWTIGTALSFATEVRCSESACYQTAGESLEGIFKFQPETCTQGGIPPQ